MTEPSTEAFLPTIRSEQASADGVAQAMTARAKAARSVVCFIVYLMMIVMNSELTNYTLKIQKVALRRTPVWETAEGQLILVVLSARS